MMTTTDVNFKEVRRLVQMWGGSYRKCPLCRFNLYLCIPAFTNLAFIAFINFFFGCAFSFAFALHVFCLITFQLLFFTVS